MTSRSQKELAQQRKNYMADKQGYKRNKQGNAISEREKAQQDDPAMKYLKKRKVVK